MKKTAFRILPPITRTMRNAKKSKYGDINDTEMGTAVANQPVMLPLKISSMCMLRPLATLAEPEIERLLLNEDTSCSTINMADVSFNGNFSGFIKSILCNFIFHYQPAKVYNYSPIKPSPGKWYNS